MVKTKVLSVVANPNERPDGPSGFGLVATIEKRIASFLEETGGAEVSYELAGAAIDTGAGSAHDTQAVFGRTLVVLKYELGLGIKRRSKK